MGVTEDYKLSMYQDYGPLCEKHHIRLVRNNSTGQICVKKTIDYTQQDVLEFRRKNNSSYFPKLYEIIETEETFTIIEEYVNGLTLEEYMMAEPLAEDVAVKIACQVCGALLELHHATPMIVYRDIKAENIMITTDGQVKLIDFNISRSFQEGKKRDTVLLGTAEYAAPEQFGYFQTDNRTDIYAFGILFNYMLTGKFPVEYITQGKFSSLIAKCIELEPSKRYQSIEEILLELCEDDEQKEMSEALEESSWMIPGFRSKTVWKMLLASAGYLFILFLSLSIEFTQENGELYPLKLQWTNRCLLLIGQLTTVFLCCNYRGISKDIPFYRNRFLAVRIISYIVTWFVAIVVVVMLSMIIENIFRL